MGKLGIIANRVLGPAATPLRHIWRGGVLARGYRYDHKRFAKHTTVLQKTYDRETLASLVTIDYHRLEKGLALAAPRPGFGRDVVKRLLRLSGEMEARFGSDPVLVSSRSAIASYLAAGHAKPGDPLFKQAQAFLHQDSEAGATVPLHRAEIEVATNFDFDAFLSTRRSIRHFTGRSRGGGPDPDSRSSRSGKPFGLQPTGRPRARDPR